MKRFDYLKPVLVWLFRLIVGIVFIFSGFTKGVDPWGTLLIFENYLDSLHINLWHNLILSGVFFLCSLEFVTGVFILTGCYRRSWPFVGLAIMCFMLPLTLWIAIYNPVSDCGCFGEALHLSNWATFIKNVILTGCLIFLSRYNKSATSLINPKIQWLGVVISSFYIIAIEFAGYSIQPLIDFRPYPDGSLLIENNDEDDSFYIFKYQKNDSILTVTEYEEQPSEDEGWRFIGREKAVMNENENKDEQQSKNLNIFDEEGYDVTQDIISDEGKELIMFSSALSQISPATTWKINSLHEYCLSHDIRFISVVAATEDEIDLWKDLSMADYEIYNSDKTEIEKIVRGNPALVYIDNGKIIWKSTLKSIDIEELETGDEINLDNIAIDKISLLQNITGIYVILFLFLVIISFSEGFISRLRKKENKEDKPGDVSEAEVGEESKENQE